MKTKTSAERLGMKKQISHAKVRPSLRASRERRPVSNAQGGPPPITSKGAGVLPALFGGPRKRTFFTEAAEFEPGSFSLITRKNDDGDDT